MSVPFDPVRPNFAADTDAELRAILADALTPEEMDTLYFQFRTRRPGFVACEVSVVDAGIAQGEAIYPNGWPAGGGSTGAA